MAKFSASVGGRAVMHGEPMLLVQHGTAVVFCDQSIEWFAHHHHKVRQALLQKSHGLRGHAVRPRV
eukprot:scaffold291295_cov35-Tisochrysis_lutea.AAC.1